MEPRTIVILAGAAMSAVALFHYRDAIAEAIRRGPWNGGGPSAKGPAVAADPFTPPFAGRRAKRPQTMPE